MSKSSGGVRGGSVGNEATEKSYTNKMIRNVLGVEQKIRNQKYETLHVFTDRGDHVFSENGNDTKVVVNRPIPQNSILTHNHPRALKGKGIYRIGNSFSKDDITTAISANAKEIRAVTPTYTFSLKRPKGGWGVSEREFRREYDYVNRLVDIKMRRYLYNVKGAKSSIDRANVTYFHKVTRELAEKYGWDYSKKRG